MRLSEEFQRKGGKDYYVSSSLVLTSKIELSEFKILNSLTEG